MGLALVSLIIDLPPSRTPPLACCFLGSRHFKILMTRLGIKRVMSWLCEVARRLIAVSDHMTFIARWGGDEFCLL